MNNAFRFTFAALLAGLLLPDVASAADFRGLSWGDDMELVKKKEREKLIGDHTTHLIYEGTLSGINVYIVYGFRNQRLFEGAYHNQSIHRSNNDYIRDFNTLNNLLKKKYGTPDYDHAIWSDNTYRANTSERGKALQLGHLSYAIEWETHNTKISAMLWSDNGEIKHVIQYNEKRSREKEQREKERRSLEKL